MLSLAPSNKKHIGTIGCFYRSIRLRPGTHHGPMWELPSPAESGTDRRCHPNLAGSARRSRYETSGSGARENIHGTVLRDGMIVLIAVDTLRIAGFELRGNGHCVAATDISTMPWPKTVALARIRHLDVGLLRPLAVLLGEDVNRAGCVQRRIVLIAVGALRRAALIVPPVPK